jgi:hypothetical protein
MNRIFKNNNSNDYFFFFFAIFGSGIMEDPLDSKLLMQR